MKRGLRAWNKTKLGPAVMVGLGGFRHGTPKRPWPPKLVVCRTRDREDLGISKHDEGAFCPRLAKRIRFVDMYPSLPCFPLGCGSVWLPACASACARARRPFRRRPPPSASAATPSWLRRSSPQRIGSRRRPRRAKPQGTAGPAPPPRRASVGALHLDSPDILGTGVSSGGRSKRSIQRFPQLRGASGASS